MRITSCINAVKDLRASDLETKQAKYFIFFRFSVLQCSCLRRIRRLRAAVTLTLTRYHDRYLQISASFYFQ